MSASSPALELENTLVLRCTHSAVALVAQVVHLIVDIHDIRVSGEDPLFDEMEELKRVAEQVRVDA